MLRIILVGDEAFLEATREGLDGHPHIHILRQTTQVEEAREFCQDVPPDVIIVNEDIPNAIQNCIRLHKVSPRSHILLAVQRPSLELARQVQVFRGDLIRKPIDGYELTRTIDNLRMVHNQLILSTAETEPDIPASVASPQVILQQVIVFHAPRGGVGKTTLAINTAAQYRLKGGKELRIVLVDFDPYGSIAAALPLKGTATIYKWADFKREPSWKEIEEELTCVHEPTGIRVIPMGHNLLDADLNPLSYDVSALIIRTLRKYFDVIVIDCGPRLQDQQIAALEHAHKIFEIAIPEIPTIRRLRDFRDMIDMLPQIQSSKFSTILNRVPKRLSLNKAELIEFLPWPLAVEIPDDPTVMEAVNNQKIAVIDYPDSEFAKAVRKLVGDPTGSANRKGFLSLFRKK